MSGSKSRTQNATVLGAVARAGSLPRMGRQYRSHGGRRADLGNRYFRSLWEANYARYLNFLVRHHAIRAWKYEARTFEFTTIRRGARFYTPDFEVTENNGQVIYDEVKGYMDQKSRVQLKRMARYYPEVQIRVIGEKTYRAIARQVSALIQGWERGA